MVLHESYYGECFHPWVICEQLTYGFMSLRTTPSEDVIYFVGPKYEGT